MARSRYGLLLILAPCALSGCSSIAHNTDIVELDLGKDAAHAARLTQDGIRHYLKGQVARAESAFEAALAADETHGPAHNNLGLLYFDQRDLYRAAWSFERAMEFMPEHAEPANNLGLTYEKAGRLNEAIEMYYVAYQIEPSNAECLGNLARARVRRGDRDDALADELRELLVIDTRPPWVHWAEDQLALVFDKQRQRSDRDAENSAAATPDASAGELLPTPPGELPPASGEAESVEPSSETELQIPYELNLPSGGPMYGAEGGG